jgi:hypothetical protein
MNSCFTTDDAYVVSGSETNGQIFFWDLVEVRTLYISFRGACHVSLLLDFHF